MQLSQMWREHLQAGCPPEMRGLNIAGTAVRDSTPKSPPV